MDFHVERIGEMSVPLNEKDERYGKETLEFLKKFTMITDGYQKKYYQRMLSDARVVKCSSVFDVLSEDDILKIKRNARPKMKECYRNAYLATQCGIPDMLYCEGYTTCMGLPIEHAFNKIGDMYIDITAELVLDRDVSDDEYVVIGEYTPKEAFDVMGETGHYGGVYNELFRRSI